MQLCSGDPLGVPVQWRHRRGPHARRGGSPSLGACWGVTPTWPSQCCTGWVGGRRGGGGGGSPQRKSWKTVGVVGGSSRSSSRVSSGSSIKAPKPMPKAPKRRHATSRVAGKTAPASKTKPNPRLTPRPRPRPSPRKYFLHAAGTLQGWRNLFYCKLFPNQTV